VSALSGFTLSGEDESVQEISPLQVFGTFYAEIIAHPSKELRLHALMDVSIATEWE
jgi:hypothetical protein